MSTIAPYSPTEALTAMLEGNRRFAGDARSYPHQDAERRTALAGGQNPFAVVLGCSDSRTAPETVFDVGLGDVFVVRTAGHVLDPTVLGSIEYGVGPLGVPLVAVLGHSSCGAVTAASQSATDGTSPGGYIDDLVERVVPSVLAARADGAGSLDEFVDAHVRRTVEILTERSRVLSEAITAGRCAIAGLSYRLDDGSARVVTGRGPLGEHTDSTHA